MILALVIAGACMIESPIGVILIRAELVPVVHVGRKKLAAVEDVQDYLAAPISPDPEPGIRRVAV